MARRRDEASVGMVLRIGDLDVAYPYPRIYPEQVQFMHELKRAIDGAGHALLELPACAGRTSALLAFYVSYKAAHPTTGKVVICTRTVQECSRLLEELQLIETHRHQQGGAAAARLSSAGLPTRQQVANAREEQRRLGSLPTDSVDTNGASEYDDTMSAGVHSLDAVVRLGLRRGWGAWQLAMHVARAVDVLICLHEHVLDPKLSPLLWPCLGSHPLVAFDEAHNLANLAVDVMSVHFSLATLSACTSAIQRLTKQVEDAGGSASVEADVAVDANEQHNPSSRLNERLLTDYHGCVHQVATAEAEAAARCDSWLAVDEAFGLSPAYFALGGGDGDDADDAGGGDHAIPGNLRRARNLLWYVQRLVHQLRRRMEQSVGPTTETPFEFLHALERDEDDFSRSLRHVGGRVRRLLRTLESPDAENFAPLLVVTDFATIIAAFEDGFGIHITPYDESDANADGGALWRDERLHLCCYDAAIAIRPILMHAGSAIFTSGTLGPLAQFASVLGLTPAVSCALPVVFPRDAVRPLFVARGADQSLLKGSAIGGVGAAAQAAASGVVRNFGKLLEDVAGTVPDGIIACFGSYAQMQHVLREWGDSGQLRSLSRLKLLFFEACDVHETSLALDHYKRACDCGRGAIFLTTARSKLPEAVSFDGHYGRGLVLLGLPLPNLADRALSARLDWVRRTRGLDPRDLDAADGMRHAAQCVDRVLRGKSDYSVVFFADRQFADPRHRAMLPVWLRQFLSDTGSNLSTQVAVLAAKQYLRDMAQGACGRLEEPAERKSTWVCKTGAGLSAPAGPAMPGAAMMELG